MINVGDYLNTLLNSRGMFLTLGNSVSPCLDESKRPIFWVENRIVHFRVRINGVKHTMLCFLGDREVARSHFKALSMMLRRVKSSFIVTWKFLHDEMMVLDSHNRVMRCDVVVQRDVKAVSIRDFIAANALTDGREANVNLLKGLGLMLDDFSQRGINFGGIDFSRLLVRKGDMPIISAGFFMEQSDDFNDEQLALDNKNFARMVCLLSMFCFYPKCDFSFLHEPSKLDSVRFFAQSIDLECLFELTQAEERKKISELIAELSEIDFMSYAQAFRRFIF